MTTVLYEEQSWKTIAHEASVGIDDCRIIPK
jgi:hypothetical protein